MKIITQYVVNNPLMPPYLGPWNKAENKFNNALFKFLLDKKWTVKKTHEGKWWSGPKQYESPNGELMMLPSCIAMIKDTQMREYVELYAADEVSKWAKYWKQYGVALFLFTIFRPNDVSLTYNVQIFCPFI